MPKNSKEPPKVKSRNCSKESAICNIVKNILSKFNIFGIKKEAFYEVLKTLKTSGQKMSVEEKNILTNFLQFGHKTVKDVMVPRSDVAAINVKSSLSEATTYVTKEGHTRTLIYQNTLDEIVGFVHIRDLFSSVTKDKNLLLKKLIRNPLFTTSSSKLIDLLVEMRRKRTHIAVVVDEYGGTEGIVTIEDIVEEIVGDIEDEHDDKKGNHDYTVISDNTIITSGRVEIEEIESIVGVLLRQEDEDIDTIGGLVMTRAQHMPEVGDIVPITENVTAEVLEGNSRIIKRLKIIFVQDQE